MTTVKESSPVKLAYRLAPKSTRTMKQRGESRAPPPGWRLRDSLLRPWHTDFNPELRWPRMHLYRLVPFWFRPRQICLLPDGRSSCFFLHFGPYVSSIRESVSVGHTIRSLFSTTISPLPRSWSCTSVDISGWLLGSNYLSLTMELHGQWLILVATIGGKVTAIRLLYCF